MIHRYCLIVPELNDLYSGWITKEIWRANCFARVSNDKDLYLVLLKRFKTNCRNHILYTDDCLFTSFNEDYGLWSKEKNKRIFQEIKAL